MDEHSGDFSARLDSMLKERDHVNATRQKLARINRDRSKAPTIGREVRLYLWRLAICGSYCDIPSYERLARIITDYTTKLEARSHERPKNNITGYTPGRPRECDSTKVHLLQQRSRDGIRICFVVN